jgi:hypothetical protein
MHVARVPVPAPIVVFPESYLGPESRTVVTVPTLQAFNTCPPLIKLSREGDSDDKDTRSSAR